MMTLEALLRAVAITTPKIEAEITIDYKDSVMLILLVGATRQTFLVTEDHVTPSPANS